MLHLGASTIRWETGIACDAIIGIVLDFGGCQYIDGKGDTIAGPHGSILINLTDYVGGRLKRGRVTFFSKGPYITVGFITE